MSIQKFNEGGADVYCLEREDDRLKIRELLEGLMSNKEILQEILSVHAIQLSFLNELVNGDKISADQIGYLKALFPFIRLKLISNSNLEENEEEVLLRKKRMVLTEEIESLFNLE